MLKFKMFTLGTMPDGSPRNVSVNKLAIVLGSIILLFLGTKLVASTGNKAEKNALKAVQKYESLQENSNKISICVQAGIVASAYLQANNLEKQAAWEAIEKEDCTKAGVPYY